jgi:hypothetical protein
VIDGDAAFGANNAQACGVTLNKATGQITAVNSALAGNTTVSFSVTN